MFVQKLWEKMSIMTTLVLIFVMCMASYYTFTYPAHKMNPIRLLSTKPVYKNESSEEKFIFSKESVFKTLLGIRNKNCYALNEIQNRSTRRLLCQNLQRCNIASEDDPDLPEGCQQRLPKCIIIGIHKSGTTELTDFLSMHPSIVIKWNSYRVQFYHRNWEKGPKWHRRQMPFSFKEQIPLFKGNFYFPEEVPERIKLSAPNMKLLLIVRNPVDRAVSSYTFRKPERPLSDLGNTSLLRSLTLRWRYDEPFERYLRYFNRSQIHVVDSEKFRKDPQSVLFRIEAFLNLPHVIKKEDFVFNKDKDFFCLRDVNNTFSSCYGDDRGRRKIQDDTKLVKALLKPFFTPQNERFFNLTGLRFNWR